VVNNIPCAPSGTICGFIGDDIDDVNDDSLFVFVILDDEEEEDEEEDEEDDEQILCVFVNVFEEAENLRVCVIFK
jgi:hypothetical protein